MKKLSVLVLALAFQSGMVFAEAFPSSISRKALHVGVPSERLSLGLTYEDINIGVDFDHLPDGKLEAQAVSAYLGYDILPWLTLFGTLGASEVDVSSQYDTDPGLKISGGASAYLWEGDVLSPPYMAGRFTVKAALELSYYDSDYENGDVNWFSATASLPLGYEIFDESPESVAGVDTSLAFYIGPAMRYLSGSWDFASGSEDFEGKEILGLMGGIDVYISQGLSIGAQACYFDEATVMGSVRFHL
jgi:opacity protein-like surface antigen